MLIAIFVSFIYVYEYLVEWGNGFRHFFLRLLPWNDYSIPHSGKYLIYKLLQISVWNIVLLVN